MAGRTHTTVGRQWVVVGDAEGQLPLVGGGDEVLLGEVEGACVEEGQCERAAAGGEPGDLVVELVVLRWCVGVTEDRARQMVEGVRWLQAGRGERPVERV